MGVFKMFSSSSADKKSRSLIHFSDSKISEKITVIESKTLPNPKPDNYKILRHETIGEFYTRVRENIYIVVYNIDMSIESINLNNF